MREDVERERALLLVAAETVVGMLYALSPSLANGVTDATGTIDEGEVLGWRAVDELDATCRRVRAALPPVSEPGEPSERERRLEAALGPLLDLAEAYEVQIDGEWGSCRSLAQIEADGDLASEIAKARAALAPADGKERG